MPVNSLPVAASVKIICTPLLWRNAPCETLPTYEVTLNYTTHRQGDGCQVVGDGRDSLPRPADPPTRRPIMRLPSFTIVPYGL